MSTFIHLAMFAFAQDEWHPDCGDGSWKNVEFFKCNKGHGMFVVLSKLRPDPRYAHAPRGRNRK